MAILQENAVLGSYRVTQAGDLPHLGGRFYQLVHEPTGARHIHIDCPDDNNAFMVGFPTVPQDSTGIAHILEHIVLCGSERFPVRDPFFAMGPRSLSTFMNAMTWPDRTVYPFSTRNAKDYYNLLEVYLDACFFPKIDYNSYRQEAWRYQFAELEDPTSPLRYEGVVFNEMKGGMSSPSSVMWDELGRALFPNLTYANNSGGDPRHIPDLSWEALKAFHTRHYHPSNAFFFTYGNLGLEETLGRIERLVLSRFKRINPQTQIPDQPRFAQPITYPAAYPLAASENPDKKSQVLMAWMTVYVGDTVDVLGLEVLQRVLLSNAASPLRKALIESNIGEALADGTGYIDDFRETVFAAGLKGVNPEDASAVEKLILDTLGMLAEQGVDAQMVEATIHRMELESREVSNQGLPFALKVGLGLMMPFINGGDPYLALKFDEVLAQLNQARAKGGYFEGLIRRYLLDNPHRATIVLKPDAQMTDRLETQEREKLEAVRAGLSTDQIEAIVAEAKALKKRQETTEDLSVLPTLELSDIPMQMEDVTHRLEALGKVKVGLFPQPTGGISYVDLQFDAAGLPDRLKDLLPLFSFVLTKMGGGDSDYLQMAARVDAHTGGVGAAASLRNLPHDLGQYKQSFGLSGKALYRNHQPFFAILRDFASKVRWDLNHLKNLLGQYKAGFEARVVNAGHMFAWYLAENQLGGRYALQERWEGLSQLATLKRLASLDEAGFEALLEDLKAIHRQLFSQDNLLVCITSEEAQLSEVLGQVRELLEVLPAAGPAAEVSPSVPQKLAPVARTTAVPVAYDAKVVPTVPYTHPDAPVLLVLSNLLGSEYFHKEIREKGGAYGGWSVARAETGTFVMLSYRDPHIVRTFEVYQAAPGFVEGEVSAEKLKEAILGAAGSVDPLLSPDNKGRVRFFSDAAGYTLEQKMQFKQRLLEVTLEDLRRVARTYLSGQGAMAVVSGEEKIKEANTQMGGIFEVKPI